MSQSKGVKKANLGLAIALAPNDIESVSSIVEEISSLSVNVQNKGDLARQELAEKARTLVRALETPRETMIKHCWAQPSAYAAISLGIDVGLFDLLCTNEGPQNANELAKTLGIDPPMLCRLMRHLGSMGYLIEVDADEYLPTNFAKSMSIPVIAHGYPGIGAWLAQCFSRFHEFARKTNWRTPTDMNNGCLQYVYNTKLDMFAHLHAHPPVGPQFDDHMGGYRQGRPSWMTEGYYPVKERLIDGADSSPTAPFLIDIGGGKGQDLDEFLRRIPDYPGRLILQDLPRVITQITDLDPKIDRMEHDFYQEQPVKGARAYYMHSTLHDWPDDVCVKIIEQIKPAMKPGYSRILVNEHVIPPKNAHWEATALDILMLTLLSSRERTRDDWYNLLEGMAGLKITGIWSAPNGIESVIECELPSN